MMETRRSNWPAWLALGIALLALLVAFGSAAMSRWTAMTMWSMPRWSTEQAAPAMPPGLRERGGRGQFMPPGLYDRGGRGQVVPPGIAGGPGHRHMGGWDLIGGFFRLIDGLLKLAALALLIWLGVLIFRQRRTPPAAATPPAPPPPPTTPAGHDPRYE